MIAVGDRIIELRKHLGLSQRQLATLSGVSQSGLSSIESNSKSPSLETLSLICKALNISLSELLNSEKIESNITSYELQQLLTEASKLSKENIKILISSAKAMYHPQTSQIH